MGPSSAFELWKQANATELGSESLFTPEEEAGLADGSIVSF